MFRNKFRPAAVYYYICIYKGGLSYIENLHWITFTEIQMTNAEEIELIMG